MKKLFITLSNINRIIKSLTPREVFESLTSLEKSKGDMKILIVKEAHKSEDFHYHILVVMRTGLSKNTYVKDVREIFPLFTGRLIDVQGVKSLRKTVDYLLKDSSLRDVVTLLDPDRPKDKVERIFCHNAYVGDFLQGTELITPAKLMAEIKKFTKWDDFLQKNFTHSMKYTIRAKLYEKCWNVSRILLEPTFVVPEVWKYPCSMEEFLRITFAHNIS